MRKLMLGLALGALVACGGTGTVTGPEEVSGVPGGGEPTAVAATPAPQPVAVTPAPGSAFKLSGAKGVLILEYSGSARTSVQTYYTSFDDQTTKFAVETHNVEPNSELKREIGSCRQGDAEQVGGGFSGGVFFDKNGDPFNPTRNPEKVAECRVCVPVYTERTAVTYEGEGCRRVKVTTVYTLNSCTGQETKKSTTESAAEPVYETVSSFTVRADTHVNGSFLYRVREDFDIIGTLVWEGQLPKGGSYTQNYPANGKTLRLALQTGQWSWEFGENVKAECPKGPSAAWNEDITFQCKRVNICESN